jgi:hypothetical protein
MKPAIVHGTVLAVWYSVHASAEEDTFVDVTYCNRFSGLGARRSLDSLIRAKILLLGLRAKKRDESSHNLGKDATIFKVRLCLTFWAH